MIEIPHSNKNVFKIPNKNIKQRHDQIHYYIIVINTNYFK